MCDANAQMSYWTSPPYKIDFTSTNPTISNITGASTDPFGVANGAYDENGNLLFYIRDNEVLNSNSSFLGFPLNLPTPSHEISIVPVPGQCRKFYIIGFVNKLYTSELRYSLIDCSNPTFTITYPLGNTPLFTDGGQDNGIAVSKLIGNTNTRFLYTVSQSYIKKWIISSTGITLHSTANQLLSPPSNQNYETFSPSELELSPNGQKLVFSSSYSTDRLFECNLDANGNFASVPYDIRNLPSGVVNVQGVEINAASTQVYLCTNNGLYRKAIGSNIFTQISGTSNYSNSFIELAKDGFMYVASNTGILGKLNTTTNTITTSGLTQLLNSNDGTPSLLGAPYTLPDQIDGENYSYFFGVPLATAGFKINNLVVNCNTAALFYNCNAITLNNTSTNTSQYQISITPTSAAGSPIGGAIYTSAWLTSCPTDLKNLPGTNGTWLANNIGYFKINIALKNSCGSTSPLFCAFVQIATTPGPTENLTIYGKNSTNYNPSQTIANPILVGCYSLGMNIGTGGLGTTNNITAYQYKIQEVNCSNGAILSTLYNSPTVAVTQSGPIPFVGFNQAVINGSQGYFGSNCNTIIGKCYKLTLTVSNPCGAITDWSYFKIDNPPYYRLANNTLENEKSIKVYPNPFSNTLTVQLGRIDDNIIEVLLYDSNGREVYRSANQSVDKSQNKFEISIDNLSSGVYWYKVSTNSGLYSGELIKR